MNISIESVSFGEIKVNGKTYYSDMIIWWDGKVEFTVKSHVLGMKELAAILEKEPEIIVVGTGDQDMVKILPEFRQTCEEKGIKLYLDPTQKAADIFNGLIAQGKKAAGIFHVTC